MTAAHVPDTSMTLLRDVVDSRHARWDVLYSRYRPMMETFLALHFPGLDADDIIQETLIALVNKLPTYRYAPNETGHFRNYLTGIVRRKALRACRKQRCQDEAMRAYRDEPSPCSAEWDEDEKAWRESIYEIALGQVLSDDSVQNRTKQIFVRTAVNNEKPEAVAKAFGVSRNVVDQAKRRMIEKMRGIVAQLEAVDAGVG